MAAVDGDRRTGDVTGVGTDEEHHGPADVVLRIADTTERYGAARLFVFFGTIDGELLDRGRHRVGQYRIDTDTFTRPFHRRSAGQRPDRFFDRRVGTPADRIRPHSGAAAHIDDRSSAD